jgi:hypothetical protein
MLENLKLPEKEALCPMMLSATKQLEAKDLKILIEALDDPRWTAKALSAQLISAGFRATDSQIFKHRSKSCACAR